MGPFVVPEDDSVADFLASLNMQCERHGWGLGSALWVMRYVGGRLEGDRLPTALTEGSGPPLAEVGQLGRVIRNLPVVLSSTVAPPLWLAALQSPEWTGFAVRYEDQFRNHRHMWAIDANGYLSCTRRDRYNTTPRVLMMRQRAVDVPGRVPRALLDLVKATRSIRSSVGAGSF